MLPKPGITKLVVIYFQKTCHFGWSGIQLFWCFSLKKKHESYQYFCLPKSGMITFGFSSASEVLTLLQASVYMNIAGIGSDGAGASHTLLDICDLSYSIILYIILTLSTFNKRVCWRHLDKKKFRFSKTSASWLHNREFLHSRVHHWKTRKTISPQTKKSLLKLRKC